MRNSDFSRGLGMEPIRLRGRPQVHFAAAALALLLPWLAGCDAQRAAQWEAGVSTEVELRKQFGDPVTVTTLADGSRNFDDPRAMADSGK